MAIDLSTRTVEWRDGEYPWWGRPHSGEQRAVIDLGEYFIQCESATAEDIEWWNGTKGNGGGPGVKRFVLYADTALTPDFRWPFTVGAGEPLAECEVETPQEAERYFAQWLRTKIVET